MNWLDAEQFIYDQALLRVEETNKAIARVYLTTMREIEDELKTFFDTIDPSWSEEYQAQRLSMIFNSCNARLAELSNMAQQRIEAAFLGTYQDTFNNYVYNLTDFLPEGSPILPFSIASESTIMAELSPKIGQFAVTSMQQSLREAVSVSLTKGDGVAGLMARLEETFGSGMSNYATVARTELLKAYSIAQDESLRQARELGIKFKYKWLAANQPGRTRESHLKMNGKYATHFTEEGDPIFYVGASHGPGPRLLVGADQAAQCVNCRCRRLNEPLEDE